MFHSVLRLLPLSSEKKNKEWEIRVVPAHFLFLLYVMMWALSISAAVIAGYIKFILGLGESNKGSPTLTFFLSCPIFVEKISKYHVTNKINLDSFRTIKRKY
jgi:hypothetical protein